ncbi:glycosyl hydrolases family 32 [Streptococcus pneumoniae]|nr:glycosyl hydrolases family 32 [Streptococcus pneumoniae]
MEKKGFVRLYKAVNNDYTNWQAVGDLDFANDRTAYMMECPNLVFVEEHPVLLYCPQGLDKKVLDYDNIFPNMFFGQGTHYQRRQALPVSSRCY